MGQKANPDDPGNSHGLFSMLTIEQLVPILFDQDVLVIDVRGLDFEGGHIPRAQNLRVTQISSRPQALIDSLRSQSIRHVVFSCMYSVMRAPQCAVTLANALKEEEPGDGKLPEIAISVLKGGIHGWVNRWRYDADFATMVLDFQDDFWIDASSTTVEGGFVHVHDVIWSEQGSRHLVGALESLVQS